MSRRFLVQSALFCLLLPAAFFGGTFFTHRSYFAGDLTYYWWPRKVFVARKLQSGEFPLWDSSFRCGIPFFANPDNGVLDAAQLPFNGLDFPLGLKLFHALDYFLLAFGCVLWARAWRWSRSAAWFFASLVAFGGYALVRCQFLTQISALAWSVFAAALIGSGLALPAALAGLLALLAGHWETLIVAQAALLPVALSLRSGPFPWRRMLWGGGLALAAAAVQLAPAWVCARQASWGREGVALEKATVYSLSPKDYLNLAGVERSRGGGNFDNPSWVRSLRIGIAAILLALWGSLVVPRRTLAVLTAVAALCFLLSLGLSDPVSAFLYERLHFLSFLRYPARWGFGVAFALVLLASAGFRRLSALWRLAALSLTLLQLLWCWRGALPAVGDDYFGAKGELARGLQERLGGGRYFLTPKAERMLTGFGPDFRARAGDLRDRLYVRTALVYGLAQAGGFGEPLTPARFDAVLEAVDREPSPSAARSLLSRCAVAFVLSPDEWKDAGYIPQGGSGWRVYRNPQALPRAYWIDGETFRRTQDLDLPRAGAKPVELSAEDEKIRIRGTVPAGGKAVLADVFYPGWKAWVNGRRTEIEADGGAFRAVEVPERFELFYRYRPAEFLWGLGATVLAGALWAACGLAAVRRFAKGT